MFIILKLRIKISKGKLNKHKSIKKTIKCIIKF